jgi:hypothetical protein
MFYAKYLMAGTADVKRANRLFEKIYSTRRRYIENKYQVTAIHASDWSLSLSINL